VEIYQVIAAQRWNVAFISIYMLHPHAGEDCSPSGKEARKVRHAASACFRILACHARRDARRQLRAISARATRRGATRPFDVELALLGGRDNAREFTHPCGLAFPAEPRKERESRGKSRARRLHLNPSRVSVVYYQLFPIIILLHYILLSSTSILRRPRGDNEKCSTLNRKSVQLLRSRAINFLRFAPRVPEIISVLPFGCAPCRRRDAHGYTPHVFPGKRFLACDPAKLDCGISEGSRPYTRER